MVAQYSPKKGRSENYFAILEWSGVSALCTRSSVILLDCIFKKARVYCNRRERVCVCPREYRLHSLSPLARSMVCTFQVWL